VGGIAIREVGHCWQDGGQNRGQDNRRNQGGSQHGNLQGPSSHPSWEGDSWRTRSDAGSSGRPPRAEPVELPAKGPPASRGPAEGASRGNDEGRRGGKASGIEKPSSSRGPTGGGAPATPLNTAEDDVDSAKAVPAEGTGGVAGPSQGLPVPQLVGSAWNRPLTPVNFGPLSLVQSVETTL